NVTEILVAEDHPKYRENFAKFHQQGYIRDLEHSFLRKDGSKFPILLNATAIYDDQGSFIMSRAVVTDITALKKIEQKLVETNE
ncbi:PAS domain S-box protein, partial [Enterococcus casseliflavus]|uniref:PAS domain S-box protein n=1 Tax=Enterococcus casseliflavus TaxID=37734 RepID=UPI003D11AC1F